MNNPFLKRGLQCFGGMGQNVHDLGELRGRELGTGTSRYPRKEPAGTVGSARTCPQRGAPCSLACRRLGDCAVLRASAGGVIPARRALLLAAGAGLACPAVCCMGHGRMSSETLGHVWCRESTCCPIMRILCFSIYQLLSCPGLVAHSSSLR